MGSCGHTGYVYAMQQVVCCALEMMGIGLVGRLVVGSKETGNRKKIGCNQQM
jgi:hypothetical protein